jgi:hypothetical protein
VPCLRQPTIQKGLALKEGRPHRVVTPGTFLSIDHLTTTNIPETDEKTIEENIATKQRPRQATSLGIDPGTIHPTAVEGPGNSRRENGRLQNRPKHHGSLQPTSGPYPSSRGAQEHFALSLSELFELSAHPIVTLFFFFNTKNTGHRVITS